MPQKVTVRLQGLQFDAFRHATQIEAKADLRYHEQHGVIRTGLNLSYVLSESTRAHIVHMIERDIAHQLQIADVEAESDGKPVIAEERTCRGA